MGSTESVTYLHTDHLYTPRYGTNQSGVVTWRWDGEAFGSDEPNEDADGDDVKTTVNLRFPSQYKDVEKDSYYNYFRDYNPALGRYVQSDPIGLAAGVNTFGYVKANPMKFFDPLGLLESITPDNLFKPRPRGPSTDRSSGFCHFYNTCAQIWNQIPNSDEKQENDRHENNSDANRRSCNASFDGCKSDPDPESRGACYKSTAEQCRKDRTDEIERHKKAMENIRNRYKKLPELHCP